MKIGMVKVSESLLLNWLQLSEGKIRTISFDESALGVINFCIEHSEMPDVKEWETVPVVNLTLTTSQDPQGNRVSIREPINF